MPHEYIREIVKQEYPADLLCTQRLERTIRSFKEAGFSYDPSVWVDKRYDDVERENIILQKELGPKYVRKELVSLMRVALPAPNMFLNDENELITKSSALYLTLVITILDEAILDKRGIETPCDHRASRHHFHIGRIPSPILEAQYHQGKADTMKIVDFNYQYHVEDSPANIKKIFKEYGRPTQKCKVAIANKHGHQPWKDHRYTVPNEEEFMTQPIDLLISANCHGLLSNRAGGTKAMLEWQRIEKQLVESGSTTELELSQITKEDILTLLKQKKVTKK